MLTLIAPFVLLTAGHVTAKRHRKHHQQNYGYHAVLPVYNSDLPVAETIEPPITTVPSISSDVEASPTSTTTLVIATTTSSDVETTSTLTASQDPTAIIPASNISAPTAHPTFFLHNPALSKLIYFEYDGDFGGEYEDYGFAYVDDIAAGPTRYRFTLNEQGNLVLADPDQPYTGWIAHAGVIFVRPGSARAGLNPICTCSINQDTLELACNCGPYPLFCWSPIDDRPYITHLYSCTGHGEGFYMPINLYAVPVEPATSTITSS